LLFSSQKSTKPASPLTPKTTWGWRRENIVGEEEEKEQGGVEREKGKLEKEIIKQAKKSFKRKK
jgi:hypothetical protein